ncbi:hypothetical protein EVAR_11493_1 [Eumeta japonica]|uniref:Uncharacterized protein n=1 Tax=Eumeta variegata TaxID=151549 RepID=A0A4C1TYM1_EUMVA|nr:hypothetical protein EVAR_11493_1 [Eumeta japonica]
MTDGQLHCCNRVKCSSFFGAEVSSARYKGAAQDNSETNDLTIPTLFWGCVRPLSLFYSDASANGVEERSFVPRSRSHARLRNATMSHAFLCVQPAFIDL